MPSTAFLYISLALAGMTAIIWLPYLWPAVGRRVRRNSGPWLINFDRRQLGLVVLRDIGYTLTFWSIYLLAGLWSGWYRWVALGVGMVCFFLWIGIAGRLERDGEESSAIRLLSSASLTKQELAAFLGEQGALICGRQRPYIGRLTYPNGYLWIRFATDQLYEFDPASYTAAGSVIMTEMRERLIHLLDGQPATMLGITVTKTALGEGERAAADLVLAFAQRWPCVVETSKGELVSVQDIIKAVDQQHPIFQFKQA